MILTISVISNSLPLDNVPYHYIEKVNDSVLFTRYCCYAFLDPGTVCRGVLGKGRYCHNKSAPDLLQLFYTDRPKKPKESNGQMLR